MMARALLLLVLVIWLWATSASPVLADPISAAVVTYLGVTGTAAAVTAFVVRSAIYSFASWAASRISRALSRGREGAQERQATITTLSIGEVPRELIVGRAVTGGSLIDAFNFGGQYGTDTVVRVIALADHEVTQLEGFFVDDSYQGFSLSGVQAGFNGKLDIQFVNASAAGGVPPARFASQGGWTAADKLIGVAHVWVAYTIDEGTWTGHPAFRFLVKGAKFYNPAKDAALGYEGPDPHVWADPATHEFTENASVIEYNYRRGIYVTGRHGQLQHLLLGRGLTAEQAPPEAVLPWIALCDELVGGEPRYRAAGVITTADGHDVVAQWLAEAMAGMVVQREGGIEVEPGHAKAPVMTITDGDLVVGEKVVFNAFSPDGSTGRYNTIIPRYVEPTQGWQDHSGPVRRDLDDITEDGGPRELTLPLPLVTWGVQADRCAEIRRRRERLEKNAAIVLPPRFAALEEGDWIDWQSDRRHGGETVTYQVEEAELGPNWRQYLVLREISAEVFEDDDGRDDESDPLTPTPQPEAVYLAGVSIYPLQMSASETGAVQPALRFGWSVPVDAAIVAIRAEVRLRGATDVSPTLTEAVNAGSLPVTQGVLSGSWLEARLVPVTRTTRAVVPSPWVQVRVGTGVSDDLTPTGPGRRRIFWDQLDEARARFDADMVAEAEAEGNETLTRDLVDVLAEVNPVQRRALLRASELDLEGSSLDLLGLATRGELGLDDFGNITRPLLPDIIIDSGLVTGPELTDATDGLALLIGGVSDDVAVVTGDVDALTLVVDGHTSDIGGLGGDLLVVSDDLSALSGSLGALALLDQANLDTQVTDGTTYTRFSALEQGRLAGMEDGATAGADFLANLLNLPLNLAGLIGSEELDNAAISLGADGGLIGGGGGAVTLLGLGFTGALDATNDATVDDLINGLTVGSFVPLEAGGVTGQGDLALLDAVDLDTHVVDGATYKRFTATEQTKLLGIAPGAEVNPTDLLDLDPAAHAKLDGLPTGAELGALALLDTVSLLTQVTDVPANVLALTGAEVLDAGALESDLIAGLIIPAEAATFTNKGALAERDDVDTPQIVPLSVTASGRAVTDAQITIGENGSYVLIQTLVLTTTGKPVEIDWGAYFRTKSPSGFNIRISLNRSTVPTGGGSPVTAGPDFGSYQALELSGDDFYFGLLASKAKDNPPAGTTTYTLSAGSNLGTFLTTKTAEKRYLSAREYKSE